MFSGCDGGGTGNDGGNGDADTGINSGKDVGNNLAECITEQICLSGNCPENTECNTNIVNPRCQKISCGTSGTPCVSNRMCDLSGDYYCSKDNTCKLPNVYYDPTSGLSWQNPSSTALLTGGWEMAMSLCKWLELEGGGWRLPTISELRSLIRNCPNTEKRGSCGVTDTCLLNSCKGTSCEGCSENGDCSWPTGLEGLCSYTWSSSTVYDDIGESWYVDFSSGLLDKYVKDMSFDARSVS
jgi:hypothetical protein